MSWAVAAWQPAVCRQTPYYNNRQTNLDTYIQNDSLRPVSICLAVFLQLRFWSPECHALSSRESESPYIPALLPYRLPINHCCWSMLNVNPMIVAVIVHGPIFQSRQTAPGSVSSWIPILTFTPSLLATSPKKIVAGCWLLVAYLKSLLSLLETTVSCSFWVENSCKSP